MKKIIYFSMTALFLTTSVFSQTLDRTKKPVEGPSPSVKFPAITKTTLSNGIELWTVERNDLPVIELQLTVKSGSASDPKGKTGIASLTARMLKEGTKTKDVFQIENDIEFLGATVNTGASQDRSFIAVKTLSKNIDATLAIVQDILLNATFPDKEFEMIKTQLLTTFLQQKDQPAFVANVVRDAVLYGTSHPYGTPAAGNENTVKEISKSDLVSFYQTFYKPNNSVIFASGNFKTSELKSKLEKAFSSWKKGDVPAQVIPPVTPIKEKAVYFYNKVNAAQSEIRFATIGPKRNASDYFDTWMMNFVLGGEFSSRINMNLRETKGFTYGSYSSMGYKGNLDGIFSTSGGFRTNVTDSTLIELFKEMTAISSSPVSDEEIAFAKESNIKSIPSLLSSNNQIVGRLSDMYFNKLSDKYVDELPDNINKVTKEKILASAKNYITPNNVIVVIAGDIVSTLEKVKALKIGKVYEVDAFGNVLKEL